MSLKELFESLETSLKLSAATNASGVYIHIKVAKEILEQLYRLKELEK